MMNLKSATIPIMDHGLTASQQMGKVYEECFEIVDALVNEHDVDHMLEECCDVIQATINLMEIIKPGSVMESLRKHELKMAMRNYKVIDHISVRGFGEV